MNKMQRDVLQFNQATGTPFPHTLGLRDVGLRAALIREEADETVGAMFSGDLVGAIDGLCDLVYVALGAACAWGVDLEPFWEEVHRTNLAKLRGPKREDGKIMKPAGWKPPRIKELLKKQIQERGEGVCTSCDRNKG